MAKVSLFVLKLLLMLLFAAWASLWVLKQTEFWTTIWKDAEQNANASVFGYNGLDFVVYTLPLITWAVIGFIYLELKQKEPINSQRRRAISALTNPIVINRSIGILSGIQIIASSIFVMFLVWTFYARLSNDFKKMTPEKSLKLSIWQYKLFRMATRSGLLAEACLALLFLPIIRGFSVFRLLGIQFEASVRYHIWLGTAMMFFATLHGVGTLFKWGIKYKLQENIWKWQKKGRINLAGEISLAVGLVIWITSLSQIRRRWFEVFYYTHHLYIVFVVCFLFHCGDRHFYMVFPGVFLLALDKLLRIVQSRQQTCIVSARVFPCKAIELSFPKDPRLKYTPTSVIFIKVPSISKLQWHPFSLSSSSSIDDHTMSIIIKREGDWTSSLFNKIHSDQDAEANQRQCVAIATEGPYGPATLDFLRYDNLFLVAGGIGITPFLSILQEIGSELASSRNPYPNKIHLTYTIKNSDQVLLLNPILHQLQNINKFHVKLKVYVTRESHNSTSSLHEVFENLPDTQTTIFSSKCCNYIAHGPERLIWMAFFTLFSSLTFLVMLICFNYYVIPPAKKPSGQKNASSLIDLLLICSFAIAIISCGLIAIVMKWKSIKEGSQFISEMQTKSLKQTLIETSRDLDIHEIHFGGRPNFQGILSNFANECDGAEIGVLVCGPESMKESVASACRSISQEGKPHLGFHSLNFSL